MNLPSEPRARLRVILIIIILATIPCYCVGLVAIMVAPEGGGSEFTPTSTLSPTPTFNLSLTPVLNTLTPSMTPTFTLTPTQTGTPTITPTNFIPPTWTPSDHAYANVNQYGNIHPSYIHFHSTSTPTETPVPPTLTPTETATQP